MFRMDGHIVGRTTVTRGLLLGPYIKGKPLNRHILLPLRRALTMFKLNILYVEH